MVDARDGEQFDPETEAAIEDGLTALDDALDDLRASFDKLG